MADKVREVMTHNPKTVEANETIVDTACLMRDEDIGVVVVVTGSRVHGIVTDRDIVIRAVADGRFPGGATVGEIATGELVTVHPDDDVEHAVRLMRERSVRRLPVVENDRCIGIVSLGDVAGEEEASEALKQISEAAPQH